METRIHRVDKVTKRGTSRKNCVDWKGKNSTPLSRWTLCLIYWVVIFMYYGEDQGRSEVPAKWKPERIDWKLVKIYVLHCSVQLLFDPLKTLQGEDVYFKNLSTETISGRWHNFFHVYKDEKEKYWSINDTEHPLKNEKLSPFMEEAREWVAEYFKARRKYCD